MKKSILIASVVALAMGAQAQVDEWVNPFKELGAYDYVQKQSDGEVGKWFLSGNCYKYPTLVEYEDTMRIKFEGDMFTAFTIVLDISKFPTDNDNINLNIKFKHTRVEYNKFGATPKIVYYVKFYQENKGIYHICDEVIDNQYSDEIFGDKIYVDCNINKSYIKDNKYICVQITDAASNGYLLLNDIEITGTNGLEKGNKKYKEYFKYEYFNEPYSFKDLEGYQNPEITTSINNDMESNTYVSNNVLYTDEPSSVYIFNASGILVKTENNTTSVDLSDLKKGVYIAKVNGAPIRFVR